MKQLRVVIFAKAPKAGLAKTRLIPTLGELGAAALARRLLDNKITQAILANVGAVELCMTPFDDIAWQDVMVPTSITLSDQGDGDLGERMARACKRVIDGDEGVLLIGTDCPALDATCLRQIAQKLNVADAVIVPAADGGYTALGLNRFHPLLFSDIAWSTGSVAFDTLCRLAQLGWSVRQLPMLHDIDEPADLRWLPADWPETQRA